MNKIVMLTVTKATTLKQKTIGLMNQKKIDPLLINTRFGIHTFFMKVSIDVVVLDKQYIVQKIKKELKPYQFFFWNPRFSLIIELPKGTVEKKGIIKGVKINLSVSKL